VTRLAVLVAAGLAAGLAAGCAGSPRPRAHAVEIRGFRYQPETVTVSTGDTLVWTNRDVVPHTATGADGWDTGAIAAGGTARWVAEDAGTHEYICAYHPTMKATVVVR
jgi:plastocyanin